MPATNVKQQIHDLVDKLPDDVTWRDAVYEMVMRREIELGLADSDANQTIPAEDVLKEERGYSSYSEHVRDLVRKDELEAARDRLRTLITEGLNSGPGRPFDEVVDDIRRRIRSHRNA